GRKITILTPGTWNLEAGPDFKRAKLALDDTPPSIGDVEAHRKTSDWVAHGHWRDPGYANVALHVVAIDDTDSMSDENKSKLPQVPTVIIPPRVSRKKAPPAAKFPPGDCGKLFRTMSDNEIHSFLTKAGLKRFESKTELFMEEMGELGANAAFLRRLFEACGYKKNSANFAELFDRMSRYGKLSLLHERVAVMWGESGLMPDPASITLEPRMEEFTSKIWSTWWKIRLAPLTPIEWRRSGGRPLNSPERRLAAMTELLARLGDAPLMFFANLAATSESAAKLNAKIVNSLTCSHALWNDRINFTAKLATSASVLGKARAADICLNVVLPALAAYANLAEPQEETEQSEKSPNSKGENEENSLTNTVTEAFLAMPPLQSNRIIETTALRWLTPPSRKRSVMTNAAAQQGAIHLHKMFCDPLCVECSKCPVAGIL
ncbi:MAG: DUF2851 family protein, partial [Victivallales bacterium]|nr:DUF2851 family protein [Victivallales bacterium]